MLVPVIWIVSIRFIDIPASGPSKCVRELAYPRKLPQS